MSILDEEDNIVNSIDQVQLLQEATQWFKENCGEEVLDPGENYFPSPLISNPSITKTDGISTKIELEYDESSKKIKVIPLNSRYFLYIKNVDIPTYIDLSKVDPVYVDIDGTRVVKGSTGDIIMKTTIF